MSFMDLNELSARELIAQYVIATRGQGMCLHYSDYELIDIWLAASGEDTDSLLLILDELLLPYYQAAAGGLRRSRPLRGLHRRVMGRLKISPAGARAAEQR